MEIGRLASQIGATGNDLPSYGVTRDFGYPHVEVKGSTYCWVVVERGREIRRKETRDFEEFLYWVFANVTSTLATEYASKNRIKDQDFRRVLFAKQVELLEKLSPSWAQARESEIADILQRRPYNDSM